MLLHEINTGCYCLQGEYSLQRGMRTGKGAVYTYDGIGSHERVGYSCQVSINLAAVSSFRVSQLLYLKAGASYQSLYKVELPLHVCGSKALLAGPELCTGLMSRSQALRKASCFRLGRALAAT